LVFGSIVSGTPSKTGNEMLQPYVEPGVPGMKYKDRQQRYMTERA